MRNLMAKRVSKAALSVPNLAIARALWLSTVLGANLRIFAVVDSQYKFHNFFLISLSLFFSLSLFLSLSLFFSFFLSLFFLYLFVSLFLFLSLSLSLSYSSSLSFFLSLSLLVLYRRPDS